MRPGRRVNPVLAWCAVLVVLAAAVVPLRGHLAPWLAVRSLAAAVFMAAAALSWARGASRESSLLFVGCGAALALINLGLWQGPIAAGLRQATGGYAPFGAVLAHLLVSYPTGRLKRGFERAVIGTLYASAAAYCLTQLVVGNGAGARFCAPYSCRGLPLVLVRSDTAARALPLTITAVYGVMILAAVAAILRRWLSLPPGRRHVQRPVLISTAAGAGLGVFEVLWRSFALGRGPDSAVIVACLSSVGVAVVPAALVLTGVRARLVVYGLSDLVARTSTRASVHEISAMLARVLGDPSAYLLLVTGAREGAAPAGGGNAPDGYVDVEGAAASLPAAGGALAWVAVDQPVTAVLVHSANPAPDGRLLRATCDAVALVLDNVRLRDELRGQLEEVQSSRARIAAAGDAERRRIERNLHDGAQQHLVTTALGVHLARLSLHSDPEHAEALLAQTEERLRTALVEIRDLARGIHPAVLVDHGLGAAVESLAQRMPLDIDLRDELSERLAPRVENAAYFVVCEALVNITKHAGVAAADVSLRHEGREVVVAVSDRGVGGADPKLGSGLQGLSDRLAAAGGTLSIATSSPGGTRISARFDTAATS